MAFPFISELKRSWDITIIALLSLILAPFIYVFPEDTIRLAIGLPFIILFPGYVLISALFPGKDSLDAIERMALSFGSSIAVVPLIGLGLNYTSYGIQLNPILWSLILFIVVFSIISLWRRNTSTDIFIPIEPKAIYRLIASRLTYGSKIDQILTVILVMAITSSVIALGYVVTTPREGEHFTEFYVLGSGGKTENYPNNLTVNQSGQVILGISNHEYRIITYTIEVWLANLTYANSVTTVHNLWFIETMNITLNNTPVNVEDDWTKQYEVQYNISVPFTGQYKIWFILLKDGQPYSGVRFHDYASSEGKDRFLAMLKNSEEYLSLNLNLRIIA